jgi:succinate-acetate transporter protein
VSETTEAPAPTSGGSIADPAPLGLAGFAMTTFLLSFINADIIKEPTSIAFVLGLALFYGGIGQFAAGMWEYRRGNTFGATAFGSFGAFWLSFWAIEHTAGLGDIHEIKGLFLFSWFIFTAYMTVAALRTSGSVLAVFGALTITFLFLALGTWQNDTHGVASLTKVGGYLGILTALLAWYASFAAVVNETHKKPLLPTWPR